MMGGVHYKSWQHFCTNNFSEVILFSAHLQSDLSHGGLSLAEHILQQLELTLLAVNVTH